MKEIKAVLFDLDNTLIDFMKMKEESCKSALKAMIKKGLKVSFKTGYEKLMKIYFKVGIESNIAFEEFLKSETGHIDTKILAAGINEYLRTKNKFLKPYPNVKPTLRKLKKMGLKLAIVTDAPRLKAYQRLVAMRIDDYFDFVIGFDDTGKKKETQIPLKKAIEKLRLEPYEIMMVGDSIKKDVIPTKKTGIVSVFAKYGSSEKVKKIKPDFELNTFSEISKLVLTKK
jgi:putative hydrolase of the HAD superfamily